MRLSPFLSARREAILAIAKVHGASNVRLFGSFARNEETEESDVDLLVEFDKGRSLLDLVGFKQDLEELLGRRVDVVTDSSLSPRFRETAIHEARPL